MKLSAILAPLIAAGVPGEVILATVKAFEEQQSDALSSRREKDRIRQQRHRGHVTSRDVTVTERDAPSLDKEKSPTPPKEIKPTHEASSLRSDVRSEPQAAPNSPTVIELPSTQGQFVAITAGEASEWSEAFPAVDVPQQLRAIRQWLLANPSKRKTVRGMKRFVVSWLSRDQDRGGGRATGPPQTKNRTIFDAIDDFTGRNSNDEYAAGTTIDHDGADHPPNVHVLAAPQRR